jgi:DNA polymerase V
MTKIPFFITSASAGFPSPAQDFAESPLDLNRYLIQHPAATFLIRVTGDSMVDAGIHDGDILVVDRAHIVTNNCVVVAVLDGEFTIKRYCQENGKIILKPANKNYQDIEVAPDRDFEIWGMVTYALHKVL